MRGEQPHTEDEFDAFTVLGELLDAIHSPRLKRPGHYVHKPIIVIRPAGRFRAERRQGLLGQGRAVYQRAIVRH
jgi:hypothetical protein